VSPRNGDDDAMAMTAATGSARILVVDNYDSFVYNLVQYLGQLGAVCEVRRNDEIDPAEVPGYDGVLLSPGPGTPEEAGISVELVGRCAEDGVPLFGVCLGLQAIGVAFGATVSRSPQLMHGKTSAVHHDGTGVLAGLPNPFTATRYHSLSIDPTTVPDELALTAFADDGTVLAARHRDCAVEGVQFHPESVLTEHGHRMLATWLAACGDADAPRRATGLAAVAPRRRPDRSFSLAVATSPGTPID
jgi:para-aminobenzoate synthetase component 2